MRGYPQWRWHLDEVFVKVNGKLCYLWRAVDHEGEVLEAVVTAKWDKAAALKLLKRIMKKYGRPRSVVTDGCSVNEAWDRASDFARKKVVVALTTPAAEQVTASVLARCSLEDYRTWRRRLLGLVARVTNSGSAFTCAADVKVNARSGIFFGGCAEGRRGIHTHYLNYELQGLQARFGRSRWMRSA